MRIMGICFNWEIMIEEIMIENIVVIENIMMEIVEKMGNI